MGCVLTAMYSAVKYYGDTDLTLKQWIIKAPKSKQNPNLGYAGNPFAPANNASHQMIFGKPLAAFTRKYHAHTADITGASTKEIKQRIKAGQLIIHFSTPFVRGQSALHTPDWFYFKGWGHYGATWTHVRVIDGYRVVNGQMQYHVMDPGNAGPRWTNVGPLDTRYNQMNRRAVALWR
jgi:uncharacterized protein YvpB